jgi:predicted site-specific integrase-resolvase
MSNKFLTLQEYALLKGISTKTAYNWFKAGKITEEIIYKKKQPLIKIK